MSDDTSKPGGYGQSGRAPKIKNKNAAAVQITAEQLMREAYERRESTSKAPRQKVLDGEELSDYQMRRRREFEDSLRRNRIKIGEWLRYASWEESQNEIARARSIYERALNVDGRNQTVFIRYAELEMKHKNVNLARNLFDRAVTILPRVDQFWYRYTYMEEALGNAQGAREIFDRWMQWEPEMAAWNAYVKFERRYGETERARAVLQRMVHVHPQPEAWLAWARFEQEAGSVESTRDVYSQAVDRLSDEFMDQHVFISFARFEASQREYERARAIYKYALERLPKAKSTALYNQYVLFEKQHGDRAEIESVVVAKRRTQYEQMLRRDARDYDTWIDYVRLEEQAGDVERTRDVYERAIAQHPTVADKRLWRRYIYLWLFYALFEETQAGDVERAREVYATCVDLVPHKHFTFAKLWLQYAWFEVRQENLGAARRALGRALGTCPKHRLFRGYIELELELREFDRVRTLYAKCLEFDSARSATWIEFARLEQGLGETERSRALLALAVEQPMLDMPEVVWKAFIDFEVSQQEHDNARALYRRLLSMTDHVKVWASLADFELQAKGLAEARQVYQRGTARLKALDMKDARVALLEAWRDAEAEHGGEPASVEKRMPKRVRKRRQAADGTLEEYFDYVFPDDAQGAGFKLLARAHQWKQKQEGEQ